LSIRDAAVSFEAIKLGLSQDKNGLVLKLSIHPSDMPKDVVLDPLGARYQVAIVKLDDQDRPVVSQEKNETERLLSRSYALCRNPRFGNFLLRKMGGGKPKDANALDETNIRELLLRATGVEHRSAIRTDEVARERFKVIFREFEEAIRNGQGHYKGI
jgi:hypothetical protein